MQTVGGRDYQKEFRHRIWDSGVTDERFIETFYEGEEVESYLIYAENRGEYEDALEDEVKKAITHYERYGLGSRNHEHESQWGTIQPKIRRRAGKSKDVTGVWERQETLAQYLAGVASGDNRIVAFRKRVLSERLLSNEQALTFLSSPLAGSQGQPAMLKLLRIDHPLDWILNTNYEAKDGQDDSGPYRKLVWGRRRSSTIRPLLVARRPIFPGDHVTQDDLRILREGPAIVFPHPHARNNFVVAARNSFIGQLVNLVEKRMTGYPISLEMGVWFILTGEFVPQDPVRIRYMTTRWPDVVSRTTITLEVESWLPPEEVLKQYTYAQQEILGKTPRSLKRKTLNVFKLVNKHKGKSWSELLETWNQENSHETFKYRSHLHDTYARAFENLTNVELINAEQSEAGSGLEVLGTDSHGSPIFADKWYLLHENGYTGTFDSREEAEADSRRTSSTEVLTSKQLLARLAEREQREQKQREANI